MNEDLRQLLDAWLDDPDKPLRRLVTEDGRELLQLRVEQGAFVGVLQMELDGRPDGTRPHDCDFALDYYQEKFQKHLKTGGVEADFRLSRKQCRELFDEATRVYERYAFLLQLSDFPRVIRDTERNMRVFRFVNRYARHHDDRDHLECWWPYIIRINATAHALEVLEQDGHAEALEIIRKTREKIRRLPEVDADEHRIERQRSLESLRELEKEIAKRREPTVREDLEKKLEDAVQREEFERAAVIRDRLDNLDPGSPAE